MRSIFFSFAQTKRPKRDYLSRDGPLHQRRTLGLNRLGEGQKLLGNMLIRVIENRPIDEPTSIESLLRVGVEAHTPRGAGEEREDGAHAGKKLAVDDGVDAQAPKRSHRGESILQKRGERTAPQSEDVLLRYDFEEIQNLAVLPEDEDIEGRRRIFLPQSREHGLEEDEAPHFGKEDDQDLAWWRRVGRPLSRSGKEGEGPAQRHAGVAIEKALELDFHLCPAPSEGLSRSR